MVETGRQKRKLAAVLSIDVVAYSRLMQDDEEATLESLRLTRAAIARLAELHDGRIVNAPGDNILAEFPSAVEAVRAAIDIQDDAEARNQALPEQRRMRLRIGANLGDVLVEPDGTLYGDGVNIAARMEALAEPGGIVVSAKVHEEVKGRVAKGFASLGAQTVKNIAEPVRAFRVQPAGVATKAPRTGRRRATWLVAAALAMLAVAGIAFWQTQPLPPVVETASIERMAYPLPEEPSIAVLPFDNLSASDDHDFIADGLSENIIATLSQARGMLVIARSSTFTYKDKAVKVQQVAEDLGVRYVLEGSIQVADDRIRVTAQLIDALTGQHVLSERYDRALDDIFAVQDDVTLKIVTAMQVELTEGAGSLPLLRATTDLEAWRLMERAAALFDLFTPEANAEARGLLEEAVARDPGYALAWSGLALADTMSARWQWTTSTADDLARAETLAAKAIALDSRLPNPHFVLSTVRLTQRRLGDAVAEAKAAVDLSPNYSAALAVYANVLWRAGRADEAMPAIERAMRLRPFYPAWYAATAAAAHNWAGEHEAALAYANEVIERLPTFRFWGYRARAHAYVELGEIDKARQAVTALLADKPDYSIQEAKRQQDTTYPLAESMQERWLDILRLAGVPEHAPGSEPERPSIAVLPFDNLSEDAAQDYFVDGLTEEIIGTLARFPDLAVIARNSTFRYKGQAVDVRVVGQELGARYIVEGSVRRGGETIRVKAQLVETETGSHLWSETFDRALTAENVFAIQDDIAAAIAATLAGTFGVLRQEGLAAARRKPPGDLRSYDCVLLNMEFARTLSLESHRIARDCLEHAVENDPDYAASWSNLAMIYVNEDRMGYDTRPGSLDRALEAAQRAVKLAPGDSFAHWTLAESHFYRGELDAFRAEAERAIEAASKGSRTLADAGLMLAYAGEWDRGLALIEEAKAFDPYYPGWHHFGAFFDHYRKGAYEAALATAQKVNLPDYVWAQALIAAAYGQLGRADQAQSYVKRILELDPDFEATARANRWKWFRYQEDLLDAFMDGLRKAGLQVQVGPAQGRD